MKGVETSIDEPRRTIMPAIEFSKIGADADSDRGTIGTLTRHAEVGRSADDCCGVERKPDHWILVGESEIGAACTASVQGSDAPTLGARLDDRPPSVPVSMALTTATDGGVHRRLSRGLSRRLWRRPGPDTS
jgi:uncharacterized protein (DUF736 family)